MRKCRFLILFCLAALPLTLNGQKAVVKGSGNGYAGKEIRVFIQSDPVTKDQIPAARVTGSPEGKFSFDIEGGGIRKVFLNAGIFSFYLYVSGGKEYVLKLPDLISKSPEEEQNVFFTPVKVIPEIINDPEDINNYYRRFDAEYDQVFNRVADRIIYHTKLEDIPLLIENLNSLSSPSDPQLFSDFITFRLIMLNMMAKGDYPGRMEDSTLLNNRFAPENPACLDLAEQVFSRSFKRIMSGKNSESFRKAAGAASVEGLRKVISDDHRVSNEQLLDYIIISNLYDSFYEGSIHPDLVVKILSTLMTLGSSEFIRNTSSSVLERIQLLREGSPVPGFSLYDKAGEKFSPESFKGKYLIISFARSDNMFTVTEYGMLVSWYQRYSDKLQVVTILRDPDFRKAAARMAGYGFSWVMLDGSSSDILEYEYDVPVYPSFILIDPEGKIKSGNCPFPSEGLESLVRRITSQGNKN